MPNAASDVISSPHNIHIQLVRSLLEQPKARKKHAAFVAEGARLIQDGLSSGCRPREVLYKITHSPRVEELLAQLGPQIPAAAVAENLFDDLADTESSQGMLAVFDIPPTQIPDPLTLLVILDQLRDPGNAGTILRTAEAAGAQAVCLTPGSVDAWSPKVVRAGMGAHFRLPILSFPWEALAALTEHLTVFLAEMDGRQTLWEANFNQPCALIIGGEAQGISPEGARLATQTVRIPMVGRNESLNAAVSTSILLYEALRQRSR